MRRFLARLATLALLAGFLPLAPVIPIIASIALWRRDFVLDYAGTVRRFLRHMRAVAEGPAMHYFGDVAGNRQETVPAEIGGHCIQCGNCCMNRRCMFIQQLDETRYACGIYHSPLRRFSNCGSYPLHQADIDRYACPSYYVTNAQPLRYVGDFGEVHTSG